MKRFLLLALTAGHLYSIPAKAEISEEIHKRCLDARDYSGCVKTTRVQVLMSKKK